MQSKKLSVLFALMALSLSGWSCSPGAGITNTEPDTASGPQTYRNSEWGVSFQYPAGWQQKEYRETIEGEEIVTLAFSDTSLPETLPPEPSFPVMVFRDNGTLEDAVSDYAEVVSVNDITFSGRAAKKVVYYSEFLEQNEIVYLVSLRDGFLRFFAPENTSHTTVAENMISTLVETE